MGQENDRSSLRDDAHREKKTTQTKLVHSFLGWEKCKLKGNWNKKIGGEEEKKKKKGWDYPKVIQWVYPIQESWLWLAVQGESGKQIFFVLVGIGQGSQAKDYAISQRGREAFWKKRQQFLMCWQSGRFLGSVVPRGAADSLLHWGEVLCLAEFSSHTRHIGTAEVDTESLHREGKKDS